MPTCLMGRTAVVALRPKDGGEVRQVTLAFPQAWGKATLLAYVRSEHPNETARIIEWRRAVPGRSWEPYVWLVNPAAFSDYRKGSLAQVTERAE